MNDNYRKTALLSILVVRLIENGFDSYRLYNFEQAVSYFDKVLKIDPNHLDAMSNKGGVLLQLGKTDEAISYFDKVLEMNPNHIGALINKGLTLLKVDKAKESISYFAKVAKIDPNYDLKQHKLRDIKSFFVPIDGFVEITVRNSQGSLATHIRTPNLGVLDFDIANDAIDQIPITKIVNRDGQDFEVHEVTRISSAEKDGVNGGSIIYLSFEKLPAEHHEIRLTFNNEVPIIKNFHSQYLLEKGDTTTIHYTIFRPVE